ncbi:hypothetical protein [Campylobacter sp. RM16188]|uniref:hypothetical protein n=1 Tax=Campylobacter sp. RM16188 TaxID=1705725 RepID=UPI001557FBB8|nr:hypothetical protein [Campylobacter sp. RM16188]
MKKSIVLALILFSAQNIFAVDTDSAFFQQQQPQQYDAEGKPIPILGLSYPHETKQDRLKFSNPQILKDRFELNMNENFSKNVLGKKDRYSKIVTETIDLNFLIEASVRQLKNTDVLYIHPHFLTSINFPEGTEILYVKSSVNMDTFNFAQNLLMIQPSKDFVNGNILVTFRDTQRTYYTNIIIQKYNQVVYKDEYFNRYVIDDNYLSLNYRYVRDIKFSPLEVLKRYFTLNGDNMIKAFKKDGDYDVILINGVSFYITRDSAFGQVDYQNLRFNVSQNYNYGDRSLLNKNIEASNQFYPSTEYKGKSK